MNIASTKQLIEELGIVPLRASRSSNQEETDKLLVALGNQKRAIPFYAIFPADHPNQPILIETGTLLPAQIQAALRQAGPSRRVAEKNAARQATLPATAHRP